MDPVAPGQSRTYRFTLPEGSAGTYWYHPHPHGRTSVQVANGLSGAFIVRSRKDPLADLAEQHWIIHDLGLDADGSITPHNHLDWMNGREGPIVLINGQYQPQISVSTGQRIRVWNSCAARYLRLAIPGARLIRIGTDGGLLEKPLTPADDILLAPAERAELVIMAANSGRFELQSLYYDRQKMMVREAANAVTLAQLDLRAEPIALPGSLRRIEPLKPEGAPRHVVFSEVMPMAMQEDDSAMPASGGMMATNPMSRMFRINNRTFDMNRVDMTSPLGKTETWVISNASHMDHPFHIHGTQFQVISRGSLKDQVAEPYLAWRDTVNLRPMETVTIALRQDMPGRRMFHCHILEHEDLGMMAMVDIVDIA